MSTLQSRRGTLAQPRNQNSNWQSELTTVQETNKKLLTTGKFSDVTFVVGAEQHKVSAHRLILMSRSTVFEAMFERWNPENSKVVVSDTTLRAFNYFLLFLYTNELNVDVKDAGSVLYLAHKYNNQALANQCSELLKTEINLMSVVEIYQLAKLLEQNDLEEHAFSFMFKNAAELLEYHVTETVTLDTLLTILSTDDLDADEVLLYNAVIRWAAFECSRTGLDATTPSNYRKVADKLIPLIRFPIMNRDDFTEIFTKHRGFLTDQETLEVLTYFTTGYITKASLPKPSFNCEIRITNVLFSVSPNVMADIRTQFNLFDRRNHPGSVIGVLSFQADTDIFVTSFEPSNKLIQCVAAKMGTLQAMEVYITPASEHNRVIMDTASAAGHFITTGNAGNRGPVVVQCKTPIKILGKTLYHFYIKGYNYQEWKSASCSSTTEVVAKERNTNVSINFYSSDYEGKLGGSCGPNISNILR